MAEQVSFNDPDIKAEWITYPSPNGHGEMRAYYVRPTGLETAPGVVVVHENRGLNPYIRDVARRRPTVGSLDKAPDGLARRSRWPGNDEKGRELRRQAL